jgi:hypothetical protein
VGCKFPASPDREARGNYARMQTSQGENTAKSAIHQPLRDI